MKVTVEINTAEFIERLEEEVPEPTGGKETEETLKDYIEQYDDELQAVVEDWLMKKLIHYHTH